MWPCASPSCSDDSDVAFTAAPHFALACSFEFSAASADFFFMSSAFSAVSAEFAAVSSVFAAASFAFRAVNAAIVAASLRRARQDSCHGVERRPTRRVVGAWLARDWRVVGAAWTLRRVSHGTLWGARCSQLLHPRLEVGQAEARLLLGEQRSWSLGSCTSA